MENKDKQSFPGYPHYPASEDITQPENNNGEQTLAGESVPADNTTAYLDSLPPFVSGTDADITDEDLSLLDAAEQNMDTADSTALQHAALDNVDEDGDLLNEEGSPDVDGEDLDIPGSHADDADENIGEEDEENNYYSLGGDNHEAQEENQGE